MRAGWIKLHRKIRDNQLWEDKPFSKGQAWIDLLLRANHEEDNFVLIGNTTITLLPGQILTSGQSLARDWGWSQHKVTNFLNGLAGKNNKSQVDRKSNASVNFRTSKGKPAFTLITITNWASYQSQQIEKETKKEIERKSKGNQKETLKKIKNVKKKKNNTIADTKTVSDKKIKILTSLQKVIEAYKKVKGFDKVANWDRVNFSRFTRDAKKLLLLAENDVEMVVRGIEAIGSRWDSKDYDWTLSTVVRSFSEYLVEKKEEG